MPFFFPSLLSCLKYLFFLFYYSTHRLFLYISSTVCLSSSLSIILTSRLLLFHICIFFFPSSQLHLLHFFVSSSTSHLGQTPISYAPYLFPLSLHSSHTLPAIGNTSLWTEAVEDNESCWPNWNWGNIPEHLQVELPTFTCCFHIFSYFVAPSPLPLSLFWHALSLVLSVYLCVCRSLFALWIRDAPTGNGRQRQLEVALERKKRGGIHLLMPAKCF